MAQGCGFAVGIALTAIAGMGVGYVIYMLTSFIEMINVGFITFILDKINFLTYYTNFTYGVLSLVDVVFFLSVTGLFLFFTVRALEKKRWS